MAKQKPADKSIPQAVAAVERQAANSDGSFEVRVGTAGRFVIPSALRSQLGVNEGDALRVRVRDGRLIASTISADVFHAQELMRQNIDQGQSLADELISERREEAQRDN